MILTYLGFLIIVIYVIIIIAKIKFIPSSLSETYYLGGGNWFTIILFISSFLIISGLLMLSEGSKFQFISFLCGSGLALVGAAPKFREGEKLIHTVGASILLFSSQLWILIFSSPFILLNWLIMFLIYKTEKNIFWMEMICLINVSLALLFVF